MNQGVYEGDWCNLNVTGYVQFTADVDSGHGEERKGIICKQSRIQMVIGLLFFFPFFFACRAYSCFS